MTQETRLFIDAVELKAGTEGSFRATFSVFDIPDAIGDITRPGAFASQENQVVPVCGWNHAQTLPVGSGVIHSDTKRAWIDGAFAMDTTAGREHFSIIRSLGTRAKWSYGLTVQSSEPGTYEGKSVRVLKRVLVHEVSPVLIPAQALTSTDSIKSESVTPLDSAVAVLLEGQLRDLERQQRDLVSVKGILEANERQRTIARWRP